MKKLLSIILLTLLVLITMTGCASVLDSLTSGLTSSPARSASDLLDGYVFAYIDNYEGGYHVAKILQPASSATKNQAHITDLGEAGKKRWARAFTSHPAEKSELAVGEVVLVQGTGFSNPGKDELLATTWEAYIITDVGDLFKGEIRVGSITVPINHLRIPDTEIIIR